MTGSVSVQFVANDDTGVTNVEVLVNGTSVVSSATSPATFNTETFSDGEYSVVLVASDAAGNRTATAPAASYYFANDASSVAVQWIEFTALPPTRPDGTAWDFGGSPADPYALLYSFEDDVQIDWIRTSPFDDVPPSAYPIRYSGASAIELDLGEAYNVAAFDDDVDAADLMDFSFVFAPSTLLRDRPASIDFEGTGGMAGSVGLTWGAPRRPDSAAGPAEPLDLARAVRLPEHRAGLEATSGF